MTFNQTNNNGGDVNNVIRPHYYTEAEIKEMVRDFADHYDTDPAYVNVTRNYEVDAGVIGVKLWCDKDAPCAWAHEKYGQW